MLKNNNQGIVSSQAAKKEKTCVNSLKVMAILVEDVRQVLVQEVRKVLCWRSKQWTDFVYIP